MQEAHTLPCGCSCFPFPMAVALGRVIFIKTLLRAPENPEQQEEEASSNQCCTHCRDFVSPGLCQSPGKEKSRQQVPGGILERRVAGASKAWLLQRPQAGRHIAAPPS